MMNEIWIVEDLVYIRQDIQHVLTKTFSDAKILTFINGSGGLEYQGKGPDLIILDLGLPDMDGLQVLLKLKYRYKARILIYTIYDDSSHLFDALRFGADGYLLKGNKHETLIESIQDILNGGAPMSRAIAKKVFDSFRQQESQISSLSQKEIEVLQLLTKGLLYKEIADSMSLSINTIKNHIKNIYAKLHVQNAREAILKYLQSKD